MLYLSYNFVETCYFIYGHFRTRLNFQSIYTQISLKRDVYLRLELILSGESSGMRLLAANAFFVESFLLSTA